MPERPILEVAVCRPGVACAGDEQLRAPLRMILAGVYFVFAYRMFVRRRPEQSPV